MLTFTFRLYVLFVLVFFFFLCLNLNAKCFTVAFRHFVEVLHAPRSLRFFAQLGRLFMFVSLALNLFSWFILSSYFCNFSFVSIAIDQHGACYFF